MHIKFRIAPRMGGGCSAFPPPPKPELKKFRNYNISKIKGTTGNERKKINKKNMGSYWIRHEIAHNSVYSRADVF